jgi:hypothetical protein
MSRKAVLVIAMAITACSGETSVENNQAPAPSIVEKVLADEARTENGVVPMSEVTRLSNKLGPMKPGMIELTIEKRGSPGAAPAVRSVTACVSQEALDRMMAEASQKPAECAVSSAKLTGSVLESKASCSSFGPRQMSATMLQKQQKYNDGSVTDITVQYADGLAEFMKITNRRIGDCL